MKLMVRYSLGLLGLVGFCAVANAGIVVIGNAHVHPAQLTKSQLADIYLDRQHDTGVFAASDHLVPFDQPTQSSAYKAFYNDILGWDNKKVNSYWTFSKLTSNKQAPAAARNDQDAIAAVTNNAKAIAYVDDRALLHSSSAVKILYRIGGAVPTVATETKVYSVATKSTKPTAITELAAASEIQPGQTFRADPAVVQAGTPSVWQEIIANMQLSDYENQPAVQEWTNWYLKHPKILKLIFSNATPYIDYVFNQTQHNHMPAEFTLLPMIESDYEPSAFSSTGAVGIWQMMPGTAMIYGLDINWWYDGRRDIRSSTTRALNFLVNLRQESGDWLLAAAGYNAGGGRIKRAVDENRSVGRPTDFWSLNLPQQTKDYVPKLLALVNIIKHSHEYGVDLPYIPARPYFDTIQLTSQFDLAEMARLAETSIGEIQRLNPGLRRWATDPDHAYTILVPADKSAIFKANLDKVVGQAHVTWQYHEVHAGQTLESIASNYHTNAALLRQVNDLGNNSVIPNEGIVVPLYLNRTYTNTANVVVGDQTVHAIPATTLTSQATAVPVSADSVSSNDILSGRTLDINSGSSAAAETGGQQTAQVVNAEAQVTSIQGVPQAKHLGVSSEPIAAGDSLQTLMIKLYGKD